MNSCKLFETLSKSGLSLDDKHNPTSYNCDETCPWSGKCFYKCICPPNKPRLQEFFGGWQKYAQFQINDKTCCLKINGCPVINILHLINPTKIDDIVIFRIAKKDKNGNYNVRYQCCQSNKTQICANITELNNHIDKKCQYVGRKLTKEDFTNE